jgi:hypothetical protein
MGNGEEDLGSWGKEKNGRVLRGQKACGIDTKGSPSLEFTFIEDDDKR